MTHEDCGKCGEYKNQVRLDLGTGVVFVDPCIAELVKALNIGGVVTRASCCGHGTQPGSVLLDDGRELRVLEVGDDWHEWTESEAWRMRSRVAELETDIEKSREENTNLQRRIDKLNQRRAADKKIVAEAEMNAAELAAWRTVAEWLRRSRSRSISTRGTVFTATRGEWLNFDGWDAEWTIITVASKPGIVSLAAALEQKEPT